MNYAILQPAIDRVLTNIAGSATALSVTGTSRTLDNTGYEAFLLACVLEAIDANGWAIVLHLVGGRFVVPGQQCSIANTPGTYSVAEIAVGRRKNYEVLVATIVGTSSTGCELEADVCALRKDDADLARATNMAPAFPSLKLLLEAKNYTKGLGRMQGKSFIGTCQQLRRRGCVEAFVGSCNFSKWVAPLLNNNRRFMGRLECFENVTPLPAHAIEKGNFVADLSARMAARF